MQTAGLVEEGGAAVVDVTRGRAGQDVRLAIVLNGGVSLAVWMGGVTHEIDLLRRASRVARGESEHDVGGVAPHDREVFDAWVELCRIAEVGEVVVDVVAGTSAGGLNGTLLATAVARGVPLDPPRPASGSGAAAGGDAAATGPRLRQVWDARARLEQGRLLRDRHAKVQPPSVLDGDFFRDSISQEVADIGSGRGGVRPDPVTLFVTATALGASTRRYVDSFGQPFDVADHRRLYRFRRTESDGVVFARRPGQPVQTWWTTTVVDDFTDGGANGPDGPGDAHTALVTAARASASFPVAFAPVKEGPELARRRVLPPTTVEPDGQRWLVDGGILDNAPFQPVLDAITRRPVTGPVRRLLVYVVPSRGEAEQPDTPGPDDMHPAWSGIAGSALGYPREGDVRDDIEDAASLLAQAEGTQAGPEAAFRVALTGDNSAAQGLTDQYRAARTMGGLLEVRAALASAVPDRGAVLQPRSRVDLDALLALDVPWAPPAGHGLDPGADGWVWGLGTAERMCRLLVRDLRTRASEHETVDRGRLAEVSAALTRVEALRDALNAHLRAHATSAPDDDAALVTWIAARFAELGVAAALTYCVDAACTAYAAATGDAQAGPDRVTAVVTAGLVVEVATQGFTAYRPFRRTAPFELLRVGPDVDTPAVDASPQDVTEARRFGDEKLYGMRLNHFAAFGLPRWRAWDWTAGRLDAQTHLSRALVGRELADPWAAAVQAVTIRRELDCDPARWKADRAGLRTVDDSTLVSDLRRRPEGEELAQAVIDALMRALPQKLALDTKGKLANSLLARNPVQRWRPWWMVGARPLARRRWKRWTARLGPPSQARRRG